MKPIELDMSEKLGVCIVNGTEYLFTNLRVRRDSLPESVVAYDVRDDCDGVFCQIQNYVWVKYTLLSESMKTKVMIRKTDEDDNMLPGAFLRLEKSGGDEVDTWTSGLEPHEVSLPEGEYILSESAPPSGYEQAEAVVFSVTREQITDGYTVVVDMVDRKLSGQTEKPDDPEPEEYKRRVVIEKVNEDGDLISGAALFLEDESGNLVAEWTTDGRQKELNLEPGTYYLAEERAPSGYELADEIEFTVEEPDAELATPGDASVSDTDTIVIRMVDEKKQDEPDEPDNEEPDKPSTPSDATPSNPDRPVSSDDDEPDEPETPVTPETPETITTKKKRRSSSSGGSSSGSGSGTSNLNLTTSLNPA